MTTKQTEAVEALTAPIQKEWLNPNEVFAEFGFSVSTLAKWRMTKKHLKFSKIGKYIKYKRSDIEHFLQEHSMMEVA
jgi:hypothetical protein